MNKVTDPNGYSRLLDCIKSEMTSATKNINHTLALAYWRVGKQISEHILKNDHRAGYGDKLFPRLAKDLNIDQRSIYQTVQFYREYPNLSPGSKLSWSHFRALLRVEDKSMRARFERKALAKNLSKRELEQEIRLRRTMDAGRGTKQGAQDTGHKAHVTLRAGRGEVGTYAIYTPQQPQAPEGKVAIDLGFNNWRLVPKDFKGIVAKAHYTFKAHVDEIIDGDTLWMNIELLPGYFTRQKLRLRGIDCPELAKSAGQRAKRFVEKALKGLEFVIIKTYKDDKYGRYLTDLFYGSEEKFLNQELLDQRLATAYQE
ncbi:MAG: hypothetical protein A3C36_03420 [Omnitrophica WOR_2 bacterium RIFCSPHIGHO2_02_FULL_52_10]|nr:MAG: hypothetical protein A3C36_03420 [Omnitrophica WOR_2 bacterium RIFCSPHIGHO2_02_FULL_52_10]